MSMYLNGYDTPKGITEVPLQELERILPKRLARRLHKYCQIHYGPKGFLKISSLSRRHYMSMDLKTGIPRFTWINIIHGFLSASKSEVGLTTRGVT